MLFKRFLITRLRQSGIGRFHIIAMLLVLVSLGGCASQPEIPKRLPNSGKAVNLAGNWEVDFKLTENSQEKLLYLYEIATSQIRQEQKRRDNRDSLAGRQMVQQSIDDLGDLIKLGTLADTMNQSNVLRIEQGEDYVLIKREDDFALNCELSLSIPDLSSGQEWCGFDNRGKLIFVSRLPQGLDIVHEFVLSADTERLSATTTVKTPALANSYSITRIYMPFEQGSSSYNCQFTLEKKKTCWLGIDESELEVIEEKAGPK